MNLKEINIKRNQKKKENKVLKKLIKNALIAKENNRKNICI